MSIFSTDKRKITLIYNSETSLGKQMRGYVNAAKKKILEIDLNKAPLTGTQWIEITEELRVSLSDLINKDHPNFVAKYDQNVILDTNDWIKVITKNPEVINGSILIIGTGYYHLINPSDFVKYIENDSAGISRDHAKD